MPADGKRGKERVSMGSDPYEHEVELACHDLELAATGATIHKVNNLKATLRLAHQNNLDHPTPDNEATLRVCLRDAWAWLASHRRF